MVKALRVDFVDKSALEEGLSKAFVPGAEGGWENFGKREDIFAR
jgi:hypothetical protein